MNNKKIASEIAVGVILILAIAIGGIFWVQNEKDAVINNQQSASSNEIQKPVEKKEVACTMEAKLCEDGSYVSRTGPDCEFAQCPTLQTTKEGYKVVEMKNPSVQFSFEVPESWIAETRNSGKKELTTEEKRSFMMDNLRPDREYYAEMSSKNIEEEFNKYRVELFPVVSVAPTSISYSDSSLQIDFSVKKSSLAYESEKISKSCSVEWKCEEVKTNKKGFSETIKDDISPVCKIKENTNILGYEAFHLEYNQDIYDGELTSTKNCSGGQYYIIDIGNGLLLEINKQARADEQFEKDFEDLIKTLKVTAL